MDNINAAQLMERITRIESLNSLDEIRFEFVSMIKWLGFDYVAYSLDHKPSATSYGFNNLGSGVENPTVFGSSVIEYYSKTYDMAYFGTEFVDSCDTKAPKSFEFASANRASDFGLIAGVAIPLTMICKKSTGVVILGSALKRSDFQTLCNRTLKTLQMACFLVHRQLDALLVKKWQHKDKINSSETGLTKNKCVPTSLKLKSLTPRESHILHQIATGYSRKKCADVLHLSESTISTHLKNIYRKLGVNNRVQASNAILQHETYSG